LKGNFLLCWNDVNVRLLV